MSENFLKGKEAISAFVGRSWKVVHEWIRERDFPARKINGVWESDPQLIVEWRRRTCDQEPLDELSHLAKVWY